MLAESKVVTLDDEAEDDEDAPTMVVYEGFFTELVTGKLRLAMPYYSSVRKALMAMGCIEQLRRGGSSTPSQWRLLYEPTYEAFLRQNPKRVKPLGRQKKDDAFTEQIQALTRRVSELENWQESVHATLVKKLGKEPA